MLIFVVLNMKLRQEKCEHCQKMLQGELTTNRFLGKKILIETNDRLPNAQKENLEEFFGKLRHLMTPIYMEGFRKPHAYPGQHACSKT